MAGAGLTREDHERQCAATVQPSSCALGANGPHRQARGKSMINSDYVRVDDATLAACAGLPASILADVCGRGGALDGRIARIRAVKRLCGAACRIQGRPGGNLLAPAAPTLARPGGGRVVDRTGNPTRGVRGELMWGAAEKGG